MANFNIDYLIVGGGGGGGNGYGGFPSGAGGGGGGFITSLSGGSGGGSSSETAASLQPSTNYTITVGAGGAGAVYNTSGAIGASGQESSFNSLISKGGGGAKSYGGGGQSSGANNNKASGGGGSRTSGGDSLSSSPGTGTSASRGNNGGSGSTSSPWCGGGGGAGGAGSSPSGNSAGGAGKASVITGTSTLFAGGGGYQSATGGGAITPTSAGTGNSGTNGTGGGGSGAKHSYSVGYGGGSGGSGVVILRYVTADVAGYTTTGSTPTEDTTTIPGQTILSFITVGTSTINFTAPPPPPPITPFDGTRATTPVTGFNKTGTGEGLKLPSGDNGNQPIGAAAEQGMIRNDTEETVDSSASAIAHYNGTAWQYFAATESPDNPNLKMNLDASNTASYPGTGTAWFDLTSNANNGAISGATWDTNGYFDFDGSNDYVNVPDNDSLEWTTSKSLSVWVNSNNSSGNKGIVAKTTNASPYGWILQQDGGNVKFWFASGGIAQTTPATTLPLNTWTHIAVTYNGSSLLMYKNGVLVSTLNTSLTPALSSSPLTIGRYYGNVSNYYFNGQISKVNVYDTALTSTEVNTLFLEGKGF